MLLVCSVSTVFLILLLLQRHETGVNSAMLHTNPGGQGDAMLSAINMNAHVKQDTSIQVSYIGAGFDTIHRPKATLDTNVVMTVCVV